LGDGFVVQPLQPAQYDAWRALALASNAELASQRHALEVAEQNVQSKVAGHLPKLSVYASSRLTSSDSESSYNQKYDTESIGIQLSVPLFAGGAAAASTRQARRQLEQAGFELDKQSADILNELRRQYNLCVSSVAKIRAYELAVQSARGLIEATQKSVAGGERVNLDVLDAEQQHHDARLNLADARHAYLRAWLQLHYLAGVLGEADLDHLSRYFAVD
jgi:protease secretion system outer membrane protein